MKKIVSIFTVVVFLLICALPIYGLLISGSTEKTGENRKLAEWPDSPDPAGIEAWFNDHFAYRSDMVSLYNRLTASAGTEIVNNVAIGQDGWLYYTADGSLEDIKREIHYTEDELNAICDAQQAAKDFLESEGIKYYLMFCPDKHTVYPEYLPKDLQGYEGPSRFDGLCEALLSRTDVPVIDTRAAVIAGKENRTLFYKTDTHWNSCGGYIGYSELMKRVKQDFPNVRVIAESDCTIALNDKWKEGDMAEFIGQADIMTDTDVTYSVNDSTLVKRESPYPKTSFDPKRQILCYENPDHPELPSAVIFRDSFSRMMVPLFADSFSKVTIVWSTSILQSIVEGEKPDMVIMEYVERYSGNAVNGIQLPETALVNYESGTVPLPAHSALIQANVDTYDDTTGEIDVSGWALLPGRDALMGEKHVAFRCGDDVVYLKTTTTKRPDVTIALERIMNGFSADNAGFNAYVLKTDLHAGTWDLIVVIDDGNGGKGYVELGKQVVIK